MGTELVIADGSRLRPLDRPQWIQPARYVDAGHAYKLVKLAGLVMQVYERHELLEDG